MPSKRVLTLKERLYPSQNCGTVLFRSMITKRLRPGHTVLDLGAGLGRSALDFRSNVKIVIGLDIDPEINKNQFLSFAVRGDAELLPFKDKSFNLILANYFVEHVKAPLTMLHNAYRILRPGGYLVFRTPNLYHYVSIAALLTPIQFHKKYSKYVKGAEGDLFPKFYRMNTGARVQHLCEEAGFVKEELLTIERQPSYLMFSVPSFYLGYAYERLVNSSEVFKDFRSNIFGVFRKPENNMEIPR